MATAVSGRNLARVRFFVEAGVFFVLSEGLVRKMFPAFGQAILAFKFVYFPFLYVLMSRYVLGSMTSRAVPPGTMWFLGWGVFLTIAVVPERPIAAALGIVVNICFVPLAFLGSALYRDRDEVVALIKRVAFYSVAGGAFAVIQSRLPPGHWVNLGMDMVTPSYSAHGYHRVTSTFQFCNIYGSYIAMGILACLGWFLTAGRPRIRVAAILAVGLVYYAGLQSGSRMAGMSALICLGFGIVSTRQRGRFVPYIAGLLLVGVVALDFAGIRFEDAAPSRSFATGDVVSRTVDSYVGRKTLSQALDVSDIWGTGWGVYTMGVSTYAPELGETGELNIGMRLEGGYLFVLAQTGVIGLATFLWMNASLLLSAIMRHSSFAWLGAGLGAYSIIANLPLCMQEVSVLAILWWFLVGVYYGQRNREQGVGVGRRMPVVYRARLS